MKSLKNRRSAFSLIEVIIVAAILGLFAALVIPTAYYIRSSTRTNAITNKVVDISKQAKTYMSDKGLRRVSFKTLLAEKVIENPTIFMGEDYNDLVFDANGGEVILKTPEGKEISVKY